MYLWGVPVTISNQKGVISNATHCVKLRKSIYGLKQSPREWYADLTAFLQQNGFQSCPFDPCVFTNWTTNRDLTKTTKTTHYESHHESYQGSNRGSHRELNRESNRQVILAVYVDDITLYGPNDAVNQLSITLKTRFQLSEIGVLHWLLGIQVNVNYDIDADIRTISLSQGSYIDKILDRFGMSDCKPHRIPLATKHGLRKWQEKEIGRAHV